MGDLDEGGIAGLWQGLGSSREWPLAGKLEHFGSAAVFLVADLENRRVIEDDWITELYDI